MQWLRGGSDTGPGAEWRAAWGSARRTNAVEIFGTRLDCHCGVTAGCQVRTRHCQPAPRGLQTWDQHKPMVQCPPSPWVASWATPGCTVQLCGPKQVCCGDPSLPITACRDTYMRLPFLGNAPVGRLCEAHWCSRDLREAGHAGHLCEGNPCVGCFQLTNPCIYRGKVVSFGDQRVPPQEAHRGSERKDAGVVGEREKMFCRGSGNPVWREIDLLFSFGKKQKTIINEM